MEFHSDLLYRIALTKIPLIGPIHARNLMSYCGSAKAVFSEKRANLLKVPNIGDQLATNILTSEVLHEAEAEIKYLTKNNIQPLFFKDEEFPSTLAQLNDSPLILYRKGNAELNAERMVAIVGTRSCSTYGQLLCEQFIEGMKKYNVTTVSGMAFGIDACAHKTSLVNNIPTIAIMGTGFGTIYPHQHRSLAQEIVENGSLLTEFSHQKGPDKDHFPARNRIIAGMCDALLVVESARRGGSMITAFFANDYNKDVFTFPGKVGIKNSSGPHFLIKNSLAHLIENADDLAEILRWEENSKSDGIQKKLFLELTEQEQTIVNCMRKTDESSMHYLISSLDMSPGKISGILLELEFKGLVRCLPGNRYLLTE